MISKPSTPSVLLFTLTLAISVPSFAQEMWTHGHQSAWTESDEAQMHHAADLPQLHLQIEPQLEARRKRKGFDIRIHQDNGLWMELFDQGGAKVQTSIPMGHLYTIDVRHKEAHRKVFQIDTRELKSSRHLACEVDLVLREFATPLTQEQEWWLSMPLSVTWFDKKRNTFDTDTYLHHKCMKETYERVSLK